MAKITGWCTPSLWVWRPSVWEFLDPPVRSSMTNLARIRTGNKYITESWYSVHTLYFLQNIYRQSKLFFADFAILMIKTTSRWAEAGALFVRAWSGEMKSTKTNFNFGVVSSNKNILCNVSFSKILSDKGTNFVVQWNAKINISALQNCVENRKSLRKYMIFPQ